jgi:hypothetical protein
VLEECLLQLFDLLMLTDTSGLLTGEEKVTVQGVNVAIQRETLRQRQIEFLQATNNPTDMKIMGLKGRSAVLRSVSTTIGMPGDDIVPTEDAIDQMMKQQQAQAQQGGDIDALIQKNVQEGVAAGVKLITKELTSGVLAQHEQMGEGPPAHIGTPPGAGALPPSGVTQTNNPGMDLAQSAAQAQGNQPSQPSQSMGPQTHLTGNQPGPGAKQVTGGVG